jgi:uncharacterized damage-inducible protein DinB
VPAYQFRVFRILLPIGVSDHSSVIEHLKELLLGSREIVDSGIAQQFLIPAETHAYVSQDSSIDGSGEQATVSAKILVRSLRAMSSSESMKSVGAMVNDLERALVGDSAAAPPAHILEGLGSEVAHRAIEGAPHTIYQELWHITFWQQVTLDWVHGVETPLPAQPSAGFPGEHDLEDWDQLRQRFFRGNQQAAAAARDAKNLDQSIRCPSRPGAPVRVMSVREQLESLAAHNAYHFGRIVLLRQLCRAWPPPSGGFSW